MRNKMKICSKCKIEKELSKFHKDKSSKDGHKRNCSECVKLGRNREKETEYRNLNKDKRRGYDKLRSYNTEKKRIYYLKNREKILSQRRNAYKKNKDSKLEYQIEYQKNNKDKRNKYLSKRRKNDPMFKLITNIRNLIYNSFYYNGYSKESKTENILDCSYEELKNYLESKFENWMTWENKGLYNGEFNYGWDIDHIIPVSSVRTEEELIKLNHYTNLQPLCSKLNRDIKKNKIEYVII
jgi:hypothetical protein